MVLKYADGGLFHTGTVLKFYYVAEQGNDLSRPENFSALPVSSSEQLNSQPVIEFFDRNYTFNNEYNSIQYNENTRLHSKQTG